MINRFTSMLSRQVLFIPLLFILMGCYRPPVVIGTPSPFSCARFAESRWAEFRFGVDSPDDLVGAIVRLWDIDRDQIHVFSQPEESLRARWADNINSGFGAAYSALFREERRLIKVDVLWQDPQPTLTQVIDCLGFPEYYEAIFQPATEGRHLRLGLWYTEKGLVVNHDSFDYREPPPAIHPKLRMDGFIVVTAGDPEQMAPNVYTVGYKPAIQAYGLCVLRPWPGSIEAIEIELYIGEGRRCRVEE